MAAATPSRRWGSSGSYYADAASPIASATPQGSKSRTRSTAPPTPSAATLSPMRQSEVVKSRRVDERGAVGDIPGSSSSGRLFSPTPLYGDDAASSKENVILTAAPAGRAAAGSSHGGMVTAAAATVSYMTADDVATPTADVAMAAADPHPGEMSTALTAAQAAEMSRRVAAAHAAATETDDWEAFEEFNPYLFIRMLPPYATVAPRIPRIVLPGKARDLPRISLVLDLDETLVHCSVEPIPDADLTFPVMFAGTTYQVYVRKRPHLERFLQRVAGRYEIIIFTASQRVYAEKLLDRIDPHGRYIAHRLYREACLNVDGNFIKDLSVLGRDLTTTVLVDNSPHAFGYNLDNGVPIESWFEDPSDTELLKLAHFLETSILPAEDVRPIVRNKFRVRSLVGAAGGI